MIRIVISKNLNSQLKCDCNIVEGGVINQTDLYTFIFSARPGYSVGEEEERCWDIIHEKYGGECRHRNPWEDLYAVDWKSDGEVSTLYGSPNVKLFLDDEQPLKAKRIHMPDGTDGLNCIGCGYYFPYVVENCSNGYKCGFCRV